MLDRVRSRLTYANVMSTIAVFGVLGGGAYGAATIGAGDIKRNAVRSKHIKRGQVKSADLRASAVTSAKVKDDSLTGGDILESSLDLAPFLPRLPLSGAEIDESSLDPSVLQRRVSGNCTAGSAVSAVAADGSVSCQPGGGPPSGPAAGDLDGTYPNPTLRPAEGFHYVGTAGEPPFENGWVNFGVFDARAGFYKDRAGVVHLTGIVKDGSFGAGSSGRIFRAPLGYAACSDSANGGFGGDRAFAALSNNAIGRISVEYGGSDTADVIAEGGSAWISLDGISWRADGC